MEVSHEDDKTACKSYDEKLLNKEFPWDRNSLSQADEISVVPNFIDKMVSESINKINNGKAPEPSGLVSKMVKAAGETGVDMITELVNQIIVERLIPSKWEFGTIANYY